MWRQKKNDIHYYLQFSHIFDLYVFIFICIYIWLTFDLFPLNNLSCENNLCVSFDNLSENEKYSRAEQKYNREYFLIKVLCGISTYYNTMIISVTIDLLQREPSRFSIIVMHLRICISNVAVKL